MLNYLFLFVVSLITYGGFILLFNRFKLHQPIYELSPKSHQEKKATPSLGGMGLLILVTIGIFIFDIHSEPTLWAYSAFVAFGAIGLIDDILSLLNKKNRGLSARQKFGLQVIVACLLCFWPIDHFSSLSPFVRLFAVFIMVATSNAANLTDGLDGLLSGITLLILLGYGAFFYTVGSPDVLRLISVTAVCLLAFLFYNRYPARCFIGDTGSLGLGAFIAALGIVSLDLWSVLILSAVMVVETLSVMIQVFSFKVFKKRVFLMAPLHHHFELLGLHERWVTLLFWALSSLFLLIYLMRTVW